MSQGRDNIPVGWVETTLGKETYFVNDKILLSKVNTTNYVSTENLLSDRLGKINATTLPSISKVNHYQKGDTLFSNIRTYFKKVWHSNDEGGSSNDVLIFRPKNTLRLDNKFLFFFISSDYFIDFTVKSAKGTKMPRGDKNAMSTFSFNLPPLQEQKAIANVLSAFDDKIENLRAQNDTLEQTAQTIFTEWFGKYQLDDELPEGWRVGKLSDISILRSGYAFKSKDFIEQSKFKALKIKDLKGNGVVSVSDVSSVDEASTKTKRVEYFRLMQGDIVLAMSGNTTGKIGIVPPHIDNIYLNQRVGKFFLKEEKFISYLYYFLMAGNYEEKILAMGYGSAQPNINPTQIENIDIIIPDNEGFNKFLNISAPVYDKVLANLSQMQILTETRDMLLPKLMSGQLRVKRFDK